MLVPVLHRREEVQWDLCDHGDDEDGDHAVDHIDELGPYSLIPHIHEHGPEGPRHRLVPDVHPRKAGEVAGVVEGGGSDAEGQSLCIHPVIGLDERGIVKPSDRGIFLVGGTLEHHRHTRGNNVDTLRWQFVDVL